MTHAFVAEFGSLEDRDYYVSKDPVHLDLNKSIKHLVENFQAMDFVDHVYT